ncbi:MAG TPA: hemolysin family protein [Candidatus Saccharimonadales bacterium]|nr:hemolysin family protein [Candidatus Saccharimonadales bacterium]
MSFEIGLLIALAMLLGNAFFVGAEFGLVSARRSSIELKALNGSHAAKITLNAMEQVSLMLVGAQLGVTVCSLVLGAVGEPVIAHALEQPFFALGVTDFWLHAISFGLALAIVVYAHVVIGEMVPKNLALSEPTRAALLLVPPLFLMVKVAGPVIGGFNSIANGTLRLVGIRPRQEIASSFSRDEVAGFVKESHREGLLSEEEEHLLSGTLDFEEQTVKSVVLLPEKVVSTSANPSAEEVEGLAAKTGFSRFPVPDKKGRLRGYVHLKDLLQIPENKLDEPLPARFIRPLANVKVSVTLRRALTALQQSGAHIAQVTDSKNRLVGVIMLEDVLEELVGVIRDETQKQ